MTVPHGPVGVGVARRRMREDLLACGAPDAVVDDAILILSELLSNACRHARPLSHGCPDEPVGNGAPGGGLHGRNGTHASEPYGAHGGVHRAHGIHGPHGVPAPNGAHGQHGSHGAQNGHGPPGPNSPHGPHTPHGAQNGHGPHGPGGRSGAERGTGAHGGTGAGQPVVRAAWSRDARGEVTISVTDGGGPTRPLPAKPSVTARGGRGLSIITALARDWGVRTERDERGDGQPGVTVWAVLPPGSSFSGRLATDMGFDLATLEDLA
ncbi:hypothetical protein DEH18_00475 [Streptomyces sp. NHF165]|nr:hypothetical protein DEH18_00475 [Streptomyces sp. NHF165]